VCCVKRNGLLNSSPDAILRITDAPDGGIDIGQSEARARESELDVLFNCGLDVLNYHEVFELPSEVFRYVEAGHDGY
jgi:hypothetical protein